jgi:hypothetical protein
MCMVSDEHYVQWACFSWLHRCAWYLTNIMYSEHVLVDCIDVRGIWRTLCTENMLTVHNVRQIPRTSMQSIKTCSLYKNIRQIPRTSIQSTKTCSLYIMFVNEHYVQWACFSWLHRCAWYLTNIMHSEHVLVDCIDVRGIWRTLCTVSMF